MGGGNEKNFICFWCGNILNNCTFNAKILQENCIIMLNLVIEFSNTAENNSSVIFFPCLGKLLKNRIECPF